MSAKAGSLSGPTWPAAVVPAKVIFLAVGTPQSPEGAADLSAVWAVGNAIAAALKAHPEAAAGKIVVLKSTVPVGTNRSLAERLAAAGCPAGVEVVSNPEFLKEGAALDDFMKPDRVVVGVRRPEAAEVMRELYAPFLRTERPFLVMTPESAEMTKYAANAMLATKISFINEMANLCDRVGADVNDVRRGIGHDQRIGFQFLFPGPGYGGSCFPKDVNALIHTGKEHDVPLVLMEAVDRVNEAQKQVLAAQGSRALRDQARRQRRSRSGAWRSSRGPTTSARPRPWRSSTPCWPPASDCASTTRRRWRTSASCMATRSATAIGRTARWKGPTAW